MQTQIERDPRGIKSFEDYKKYVRYSENTLVQLRLKDAQAPSAPYWGAENREGPILCNKYQFNLRILSAGVRESDALLESYQKIKEDLEKEGSSDLAKHQEELIQGRLRDIYQDESRYFTGDDTYPSDVTFSKTCTLVLYNDHFRPVLSS